MESAYPMAACVLANYRQFASGERLSVPHVESRMLLWHIAGHGRIRLNDVVYELHPGDMFCNPWGHRITYMAARREPFLLAGVHIIPWHGEAFPVIAGAVAHDRAHELSGVSWRRDVDVPGLENVLRVDLSPQHPLMLLCRYAVERYRSQQPDEIRAREMGRLLLAEMADLAQEHGPRTDRVPEALRQLGYHIEANLTRPIGLDDLAHFLDRSPSYVGRMCRRHLRKTPVQWIQEIRINRARELLASSRQPVAAIARECGFADPLYFSKVFRRITGETATRYRKRSQLF